MELFGRRWDRWDGVVVVAAVALVVVSYRPWYALRDEGSVTIWNVRTHWELSHAVALGILAAGVHLAYRGRPEARGAAWFGLLMLISGLGLAGWHWQHASTPNVRVTFVSVPRAEPWETTEQYRRRVDDEFAASLAKPPEPLTRSTEWGFYAGVGSLIAMGAIISLTQIRSQPSPTEAD